MTHKYYDRERAIKNVSRDESGPEAVTLSRDTQTRRL
jgi:hypothetical protein